MGPFQMERILKRGVNCEQKRGTNQYEEQDTNVTLQK